jgi:hypothetical protein
VADPGRQSAPPNIMLLERRELLLTQLGSPGAG